MVYPEHKSKVHFSFYNANEEKIDELISDSRKLAMKHLAKADNYEESQIVDSTNSVFGTIYDFEGSAASNYQFFLTDKSSKFLRGALYFEVAPNSDSLAPVELYIQKDLDHLIQTFSWK